MKLPKPDTARTPAWIMRAGLLAAALAAGTLVACGVFDTPPSPAGLPTNVPGVIITVGTPTSVPAARASTGAPASVTPAIRPGGEFRQAVSVDAVSFHPYQTTDAASARYASLVYAGGLWVRDARTLQPIPNLAESWTISADGKTYTFRLRRDARWSDGQPLTAQDYAWTYDQASRRANKYPYAAKFGNIASYTAKDDYTLEIGLQQPSCVALAEVDVITPLPKHVWSKLDWSNPARNPEIDHPTVVSGPYKLKEWIKGDHATFVRNDLFFRGAPRLDAYTIRVVPDTAAQLQLLQTGQVDGATVGIDDYAQAKKNNLLKEYAWEPAAAAWDYIGFNLRRPLFRDLQVRHALTYAIPRQTIANQILNGLGKPTYSLFPPTASVYNPDVPHYDLDLNAAKSKLQQAGYRWDGTGQVIDKNGKAVKLRILFNSGNAQHAKIANLAREQLVKLGLETTATGMAFPALIEALQSVPFDYDLYVLGWRAPIDPYFSIQMFNENTNPDLNSGAYVNRDLDALFDQAYRPPCGANAQKKVFGEIQRMLADDAPYIFLTYRTGYAFLNRRIVPNAPTPLGIDYYPEQWYLDEP